MGPAPETVAGEDIIFQGKGMVLGNFSAIDRFEALGLFDGLDHPAKTLKALG